MAPWGIARGRLRRRRPLNEAGFGSTAVRPKAAPVAPRGARRCGRTRRPRRQRCCGRRPQHQGRSTAASNQTGARRGRRPRRRYGPSSSPQGHSDGRCHRDWGWPKSLPGAQSLRHASLTRAGVHAIDAAGRRLAVHSSQGLPPGESPDRELLLLVLVADMLAASSAAPALEDTSRSITRPGPGPDLTT